MRVSVRFDPANGIPLVGHWRPVVPWPGFDDEHQAGNRRARRVGLGDVGQRHRGPFGGTSGAAPMVTGAAALLPGAFPARTPIELKAVLMNTARPRTS